MPKLWNETIEEHRRAVREATLDATAKLVAEHGLTSVTMSRIAKETGIGRATLYKYFPDVESILLAWHERKVTGHLEYLTKVREETGGTAGERLEAVLEAFAVILAHRPHGNHGHHKGHGDHAGHGEQGGHGAELSAFLHQGEQATVAHQRLHNMIRDLLAEGARDGDLRDDVAPDELASYCVNALMAARGLHSEAAAHRLVKVTFAGLRPPP
ncbi:TetR/AcrR family transcriptional regulator [Nocardiopsis gilva YIM 90087]|uniref:TetR/AcrR family transcriptional regulator n=1 Tax=Nocardiopsis gilva YIM 90087 TaxID=1235441 RepID=A0A223S856_9ACTN|nr:TetR/AcrR family transcriptional regulator [Nocardiopsis gilva]ASU84300.1 TetR/AcrR family transcriptional regulator [Nocardiopsis gilva YIM 90087]